MTQANESIDHNDNAPLAHYENERYQQFVDDMEDAGFEVEHYRGRFYYEGPAVRSDDLQSAMRATAVPVQYDQMGRGYIIYPK